MHWSSYFLFFFVVHFLKYFLQKYQWFHKIAWNGSCNRGVSFCLSDLGIEKNFILKKLGLCHGSLGSFLLLRVLLHEGDFFWASVISPLLVGKVRREFSRESVLGFFKGRESQQYCLTQGWTVCVCTSAARLLFSSVLRALFPYPKT